MDDVSLEIGGRITGTIVPKGIVRSGPAFLGDTLTTALLHDLNRTIPFGTIVYSAYFLRLTETHQCTTGAPICHAVNIASLVSMIHSMYLSNVMFQ